MLIFQLYMLMISILLNNFDGPKENSALQIFILP